MYKYNAFTLYGAISHNVNVFSILIIVLYVVSPLLKQHYDLGVSFFSFQKDLGVS